MSHDTPVKTFFGSVSRPQSIMETSKCIIIFIYLLPKEDLAIAISCLLQVKVKKKIMNDKRVGVVIENLIKLKSNVKQLQLKPSSDSSCLWVMSNLQIGHNGFLMSQLSTQTEWYWWKQGKVLTVSPSTKLFRQMVQKFLC